jgi:Secretion system C-terminal sorting domain
MRKVFFTHFFIWCVVLGFAFTAFAQDHSLSKAPIDQKQVEPIYSAPNGVTTGYGADGIGNTWNSVSIPDGALTLIGATGGTLHQGGDFDGTGTFYATLSPATLITVDVTTGTETVVATITGVTGGQTITAMGWNDVNSTMYLASTDITTSELYTLDLSTGVATLVGVIGQAGLIAIGINCEGNIYSVDLVDDMLWSIDPATGVGTPIGSLGFDVNFAQDADFDFATGTLYLSAYNNTAGAGQLRSVDLTTGNSTLVMDWGGIEITSFGIEGSCGPPCPVGTATNPNPADGAIDIPVDLVTLSWTNGSGITGVEVWFDGSMVYSGAPITTWDATGLSYSTTYGWRIVSFNDTCSAFGPNWSFTTTNDPNIVQVFMDDFEGTLDAWTITNDGGDCVWMQFFEPWPNAYTIPAPGGGGVLSADSDECGSGTTLLSTATMSAGVDATQGPGFNTMFIEFDHDFRTIQASDESYVEVSLDGGSTWTEVVSWLGVDAREEHYISSGMATNLSTDIRFRLRSIQPGWDWWWAVDNFAIYFTDPVPVELTSFVASVNKSDVVLTWTTATELNNMGFEIQRSNGDEFTIVGFVDGNGTVTNARNYTFTDKNLDVGSYTYRLRQVDFDGTSEFSEVVEVEVLAPNVFALEQNYPNPFNPSTQIRFSLAADSKVTLKVFDILGQEVANLISSNLAAGSHEFNFDASNLNSGVYFYRIDATGVDGTNFTSVKKMILTK